MISSNPVNDSLRLTGDKHTDDWLLWSGVKNAWTHLEEKKQKQFQDEMNKLPKTDKGRMVDDLFAGLGLTIYNPDDLTLDSYLEMLEDSAVSSALQVIINSVISRGWQIRGGDPEIKKFLTGMFENVNVEKAIEQILSGFWVGFSVTEKVFDQHEDGNWYIKKYKILPPESILFKVTPTGEIKRIIQNGLMIGLGNKQVVFLPKKVNVFTYDGGLSTNFGNPYGVSALKRAYKDWFCKDWIIRWKQRFLELMAGGLIIANAGYLDPIGMHKQVSDAKSTSVITIRQGQTIEFIMPKGGSSDFLEHLSYHDKRIREALLVPVLLLGQEGPFSGGNAANQFELFARARVRRLQQEISWIFDQDIKQIVNVNFGKQDIYGRFSFLEASVKDLVEKADFAKKVIGTGLSGQGHQDWWMEFLDMPDLPTGNPFILPQRTPRPAPDFPQKAPQPDLAPEVRPDSQPKFENWFTPEIEDWMEGKILDAIEEAMRNKRWGD